MGTIKRHVDPSANTCSNDPLGIIPPTPSSISGGIEHEATDRMVLLESQPPSPPECSPQVPGYTRKMTTDTDGSTFGSVPILYDDYVVDRPSARVQLSSVLSPAPSPDYTDIKAVTKIATSNQEGLPTPKDTRTQLFVGNVRPPPTSSSVC